MVTIFGFKDRESNIITYYYDIKHGLLSIKDPRGITPIRNEYDDSGRLVRQIDTFGKIVNYTHNLDTKQEIIIDRLSNQTVYEYDSNGNVVKITDPAGSVTTFTYDSRDNKLTETNALGKVTTFTYDTVDNLTSQTDPLGNTTSYTYNGRHQVLTITDSRGAVSTNTYNSGGNLLSKKDPMMNVTTFTYSEIGGLVISKTDALNAITRFEYDAFRNPAKIIDPLGNESAYNYDANANLLSQNVKRTNGNIIETLITSLKYDRLGRITQVTYPDGMITRTEYNSIGKPSKFIDQIGRETIYSYDDMGQLVRVTYSDGTSEEATYDAEGKRLTSKDRAGRVTSFTYDAAGRLKDSFYPDGTSANRIYDRIGRILSTKDALNRTTIYEYDPNCGCSERKTKIINAIGKMTLFTYDQNGNAVTVTDANGHTTTYEYDLNNNRTKIKFHDNSEQTTTYDAAGRQIAQMDQAGNITRFEYDKVGQLIKVIDALNQETKFGYNELGQSISQTDALNRITRYEYDKLGRRTKRILPLGQTETYNYDAVGNLTGRTDFNGKTITFTYDNRDRLLSEIPDSSFGQAPITFTYTLTGKRASMADASGITIYTYNDRDWLISKQTPQGTLTYTYNDVGKILMVHSSNTDGVSINYTYDALNRLKAVKDNRLGSTQNVNDYSYDDIGNLESILLANGVQTSYSYNPLNRLTSLISYKGSSNLASYMYTLGPTGNRLSVAELSGRTVNYAYDNLYRLKSEAISGAGSSSQNGSINYTYDAVSNRLNRTSTLPAVPSQQTITYDNNDSLTSDGYDNNGNTTASNGKTYRYDFENRLISVSGDGISINIVYDGDGNRVAKTVNGVTTKYLVDTNNHTGHAQVVEEIQEGNAIKQYTYGHNLISQRQKIDGNWVISFYGYDGHGSVRYLMDEVGTVTDSYDYDAFGLLINRAGNTPNNYLYAGEQYDPDLGLYYNRARYLNVDSGRFWSMDSFEGRSVEPLSLHKYLYANANPVNNVDPTGNATAVELAGRKAGKTILNVQNTANLTRMTNTFPLVARNAGSQTGVTILKGTVGRVAVRALAFAIAFALGLGAVSLSKLKQQADDEGDIYIDIYRYASSLGEAKFRIGSSDRDGYLSTFNLQSPRDSDFNVPMLVKFKKYMKSRRGELIEPVIPEITPLWTPKSRDYQDDDYGHFSLEFYGASNPQGEADQGDLPERLSNYADNLRNQGKLKKGPYKNPWEGLTTPPPWDEDSFY